MDSPIYERFCRFISYLLHPFLIPTLAAALLLFGPTVLSGIALGIKGFLFSVVVLNTLILPAASVGLFRLFRVIPDLSLSEPRQRILPMAVIAACYLLCILLFRRVAVAFLIERFMIAALCCVVLVFVVNLYWKISLHMTAMGGLLGLLAVLDYSGLAHVQGLLAMFVLLAGLLASARLQLGSHDMGQILAGLGAGCVVTIVSVLCF